MNKLEKMQEETKKLKREEELAKAQRREKYLTDEITSLLPTYISRKNGGSPHGFCLPLLHKKIGYGYQNMFMEHRYSICARCGGVWVNLGAHSAFTIQGYINPNEEEVF